MILSTHYPTKTRTRRQAVLAPADEKILHACLRYRFLTARQVCRLFYSAGSRTFVQTKLKRLTDSCFLQRLFLPRPAQHGSAPSVFCVARKGINFLSSCGMEVKERYRPSEQRHSSLFLAHSLAVTDFLISISLLSRKRPQIEVHRIKTEWELKREPFSVQDETGEKVAAVIPDGWVDLRIHGVYQMCWLFEVDQGTTEQKRFRRKLRGLLQFAYAEYQSRFQTSSLTVLIIALGEKRMKELLKWVEAELLEYGEDVADLFRLTSVNPATVDPEEFFLQSPCWLRPFLRQPAPLLGGVRESTSPRENIGVIFSGSNQSP